MYELTQNSPKPMEEKKKPKKQNKTKQKERNKRKQNRCHNRSLLLNVVSAQLRPNSNVHR